MTGGGARSTPVRVVLVGAGLMGRNWLQAITASGVAELAGVVDLDVGLAVRAVAEAQAHDVITGSDLAEVAATAGAQAVINVTVPQAHHAVSTAAMHLGLPVLSEKPLAPTVAEGLSLAAASEVTGTLLMVSQSRRYYNVLRRFRDLAAAMGPIELLSTQFFRAPHFGGFREQIDEPLLVDMAIHAFDTARYVLDGDPISVRCGSFNPTWSWYRGSAAADASFEFRGGARYFYLGSWCSPGLETAWNGEWRASGAGGTALWDGASTLQAATAAGQPPHVAADDERRPEEIAGALAEFVGSLRVGGIPSGEVHSNIMSLAMVEAAVTSSRTRRAVQIEDVFVQALSQAIQNETRADVRARLTDRADQLWRSDRADARASGEP